MEVRPKFLSRAHLSAVLCTLYSSDNKTFADFEMFINCQEYHFFLLSLFFSRPVVSDCLWPHGLAAHQASRSITNSWSLLKRLSIQVVIASNHLILSTPSPLALSLSQQQGLFRRVFHPFDGNLLILQNLILDDFLHETFSVLFMHFLFLLSFPNSLWISLYIAVIILLWIHFKLLPSNLWIPWAQGLCPNICLVLILDSDI